MTREELKEAIGEVVDEMNEVDIVSAWNERCENTNYYDDIIEYNDPDELFLGMKPSEILSKIGGNYEASDKYAWMTGWGYYMSSDDVDDTPYSRDELVEFIIEDDNDFFNSDIRELLDNFFEEEDGE